jgi:iron complex transport system permease protein
MKRTARPFVILVIMLALAMSVSVLAGSVFISPAQFWQVILARIGGTSAPLDPTVVIDTIFFKLRLPRAVLLLMVGAALAGSGATYQGLFRNPLADPFLIGVASGAGLGAVIAMTIHWPHTTLGLLAVPLGAFIGALFAVLVVAQLARVGNSVPTTNLILAGVAVSSFTSAITSLLMINSTGELRRTLVWLLGGSALSGWNPVLGVLPYVLIGCAVLITLGHPLNVMQFGDEQAQQLGIPVRKVRWVAIFTATLTTAAAVAFVGVIGFVGLVVPHILRLLWGGDYRRLIPLSMLGGGVLLLLTDTVARTLTAPQEIPVGIITALIGAPFFLWVLKRSKTQNYW